MRSHSDFSELTDVSEVIDATLNGDLLNARSTYRDNERNLSISVEYPVDVMNLNAVDKQFQVCTGSYHCAGLGYLGRSRRETGVFGTGRYLCI